MKQFILILTLAFTQILFAETIFFNNTKSSAAEFQKSVGEHSAVYGYAMHKMDIGKDVQVQGQKFFEISHDSFGLTSEVGEPQRIFNTEVFIGRPEELTVKVSKGKAMFINKAVAPAKKMPCRCSKEEKNIVQTFDKQSYRKSQQTFFTK